MATASCEDLGLEVPSPRMNGETVTVHQVLGSGRASIVLEGLVRNMAEPSAIKVRSMLDAPQDGKCWHCF